MQLFKNNYRTQSKEHVLKQEQTLFYDLWEKNTKSRWLNNKCMSYLSLSRFSKMGCECDPTLIILYIEGSHSQNLDL